MKKELDKLIKSINSNKKIVTFLIVLLITGIIFGSIFAVSLNINDKTVVKNYLEEFFVNVKDDKLLHLNSFINSLITNTLYVSIIWLLGISVIGIPIIIFMFFSKAFSLGFSLGSILINYKTKGIIYGLIYIFPHHIINYMIYTILVVYSLSLSFKILSTVLKRKNIDFKCIMNKYLIVFLISLLGIIITSCIEIFIMPIFMKSILTIIK